MKAQMLSKDPKALYNREGCKHFEWKEHETCCGRRQKSGFCMIPNEQGHVITKACFTPLPHCKFTPKEEDTTDG